MSEIFIKLRIKELLKGNMKRYLMFGFVEIFLVVAGILIALAINNWNLKRSQRYDELKIYQSVRERILEDKVVILDDTEYNRTYLAQFLKADRIISENNREQKDTLLQIVPNMFRYSDFDNSSYIYQDLVNSGELKILENREIISRLQELDEAYNYMNRMENIHWDFIVEIMGKDILDSFDLSGGSSADPEEVFSYQFHNRILLLINIMQEKDEVYQMTLRQIDELSSIIEEELEK